MIKHQNWGTQSTNHDPPASGYSLTPWADAPQHLGFSRNSTCHLFEHPSYWLVNHRIPRGWIMIPCGKHTKNYGKTQFLIGKSTINGPCLIAMLNNQRVIHNICEGWYNALESSTVYLLGVLKLLKWLCMKNYGETIPTTIWRYHGLRYYRILYITANDIWLCMKTGYTPQNGSFSVTPF